ncbi:MAG: hypothetical protein AUJ98_09330 [Bacteroidetes bacterium CG2_30_33_31]|nr:MAG: hypothetical protein AUJ98_09330 [Bacteroidetes bacterium CG2_30_33_31]
MKPRIQIIFFLIFFVNLIASAQDNSKSKISGWDFGMNFGYYLPSSYQAKFYNGADNNINKLKFIIDNKYYRNDISNSLNSNDTFFITAMPNNMRYSGAFDLGFYFRRTFENNLGFSMSFNFAKLYANDFFQIEVDPNTILTEPDLRLFAIWGKEDRVNMNFDFSKYYKTKSEMIMPFFEAGININSTRVKENKIKINDLEYSIVDVYLNGTYVPGVQQTQYNVQQGGIGWGVNAGGGVKLIFSDAVSIDPGIIFYYQKINLENYNQLHLGFSFYIRLSMTGIIFHDE